MKCGCVFMSKVVPDDMVTLGFAGGLKGLGSSGNAVAVFLLKNSFCLHPSSGNIITTGEENNNEL